MDTRTAGKNWKTVGNPVAGFATLLTLILVASASSAFAAPPGTAARGDTARADDTPQRSPYEGRDGQWGYRDAGGKVVIPPRFAVALEFHGEVAAVAGDEGWIFIDGSGRKLATAFVFDNSADDFVEGVARIVDGGKVGFLAISGRIVIAPNWDFADRFSGGRAAVCTGCTRKPEGEHFTVVGGAWGYIDTAGKVVVPLRLEKAGPFHNGRASVREGGREFTIGSDGKAVR